MPNSCPIQENVPLAPLTTLGIGGPARFFAEVQGDGDLIEAIAFAERQRLPIFILGGGSNVLVADEGFPGLVIRVAVKGIDWQEEVTVGAGEDWDAFVGQCVARGLSGLECLSGIPGLVGGTPVQNVGAYGQEVSETITKVRAFDRQSKRIIELSNADCRFNYRASIFNSTERNRFIVLAVSYALQPGGTPAIRYLDLKTFFFGRTDPPTLAETREAVIAIRSRKGMVIVPDDPDCRSAGSFFKNPIVSPEAFAKIEREVGEVPPSFPADGGQVKVPAAWLIEHVGVQKGYARGRAGISSKHTLAVINRGGATANEFLLLVNEIRGRVGQRFGIDLLPEPVLIGFNS